MKKLNSIKDGKKNDKSGLSSVVDGKGGDKDSIMDININLDLGNKIFNDTVEDI